jgi:hypothetical protein
MIVHRAGMIRGQQHFTIEAIDTAAITQLTIENLLPINQCLDRWRQRRTGHAHTPEYETICDYLRSQALDSPRGAACRM